MMESAEPKIELPEDEMGRVVVEAEFTNASDEMRSIGGEIPGMTSARSSVMTFSLTPVVRPRGYLEP